MIKILYILLMLMVLPQCSTLDLNTVSEKPKIIPSAQQSIAWQQNKSYLSSLKTNSTWKMTARVGIVTKDQSASSQLDWANNSNRYNIKLNNALTFGEVKIVNAANKTKLFYDNKEYIADNPEALLLQLTKIHLPISELQYWTLGLPSPNYNASNFTLNEYAVLTNLKQAGFNINYDNFILVKNKYILPTKILMKSSNLYIKISVENWDL